MSPDKTEKQLQSPRDLHVYILPSSVEAWTDNCCLSVLSPFDCEYSSGCYCVKWLNPTEITSLRPTQGPTYRDQQKWAAWGPQTISSSQIRVVLLPIITSENNNRHTYSHTHTSTHTHLFGVNLPLNLHSCSVQRSDHRKEACCCIWAHRGAIRGTALTSAEESRRGPSLCTRMFRNIRNSKLTSFSSCNSTCHALSSPTTSVCLLTDHSTKTGYRGECTSTDSSTMQHWWYVMAYYARSVPVSGPEA